MEMNTPKKQVFTTIYGVDNLYNLRPATVIRQKSPVEITENGEVKAVDPTTIPSMPAEYIGK